MSQTSDLEGSLIREIRSEILGRTLGVAVTRLLLDILLFLHHPPLQGVPGGCYVFSLLWPEQLPALVWGAVLGGDRGISRQDLWDELGQLFRVLTTPTHLIWIS